MYQAVSWFFTVTAVVALLLGVVRMSAANFGSVAMPGEKADWVRVLDLCCFLSGLPLAVTAVILHFDRQKVLQNENGAVFGVVDVVCDVDLQILVVFVLIAAGLNASAVVDSYRAQLTIRKGGELVDLDPPLSLMQHLVLAFATFLAAWAVAWLLSQ